MRLTLIKYPDPRLTQENREVDVDKEPSLRSFVISMKAFMKTLGWGKPVGLAAPQVGRNIKLFIAQGEVYLNAKIIDRSEETYVIGEGCYSLETNRFDYPATRHTWIILEYQRLNGKCEKKQFSGKAAQIIQHELDHVEGRLCAGEKQKAA